MQKAPILYPRSASRVAEEMRALAKRLRELTVEAETLLDGDTGRAFDAVVGAVRPLGIDGAYDIEQAADVVEKELG